MQHPFIFGIFFGHDKSPVDLNCQGQCMITVLYVDDELALLELGKIFLE
jgi:hypothetical protein